MAELINSEGIGFCIVTNKLSLRFCLECADASTAQAVTSGGTNPGWWC